MHNFIIALFVKKGFLTEEEGEKMSKAMFGRPVPSEYDSTLSFVERLLTEAKLSSTRKYFNPSDFEKPEEKPVEEPKEKAKTKVVAKNKK